jgi:lipopolysaccharide export system protein LptA
MGSTSQDRDGSRRAAFVAVASEAERDRAFRKARGHTRAVRALRVVLPLTAVACSAVFVATLWASGTFRAAGISVDRVSIDPTNLTMENPSYDGFGKDGTAYKVRARTAVTDIRMAGPIRLDGIEGELQQPGGEITRLTAKWGTFDQKKDLLELHESIDVAGSGGLKARLTRATVQTKENRIVSPEPVWAEMPTGTIRARTMTVEGKARTAAFRHDVEVTLKPAPKAEAAAPKPARSEAAGLAGLRPTSGEPVVVAAQGLDVDDGARQALFRGAVVARQGESTLQAPELDVRYAGRVSLPDAAARSRPAEAAAEPAALSSIQARGGVVLTGRGSRAESATLDYDAATERVTLAGDVVMTQAGDRRVTAETLLLDQKADTAVLTGGVVVTQGRNVARAGRLAIDRGAGTARLTSPPDGGRPAGRVTTVLHQGGRERAPAKAARAGDDAEASGALGLLGAGFRSDPDSPVEVEATTLEIQDRKHAAVYAGSVVAKQGGVTVRTEQLTAHYTGETGLAGGDTRGDAGKRGPAELKRIEARNGVVVTAADGQQATGEWANYDVKANTIVLGGTVETRYGKQIFRLPPGMRLVIDLTSGVTRTEVDPAAPTAKAGPQTSGAFATSVASQAEGKGGASPACPKGAVCRSGRLELILYPDQMGKGKAGSGALASPDSAKAAKPRQPKLKVDAEQGGGWSATTTEPPR